MYEVIFPRIDPDMEEGMVSEWYKNVGECVRRGEPLFMLETEKIIYDVESPVTGILKEVLVLEGTKVKVGTTIALIEETEC